MWIVVLYIVNKYYAYTKFNVLTPRITGWNSRCLISFCRPLFYTVDWSIVLWLLCYHAWWVSICHKSSVHTYVGCPLDCGGVAGVELLHYYKLPPVSCVPPPTHTLIPAHLWSSIKPSVAHAQFNSINNLCQIALIFVPFPLYLCLRSQGKFMVVLWERRYEKHCADNYQDSLLPRLQIG